MTGCEDSLIMLAAFPWQQSTCGINGGKDVVRRCSLADRVRWRREWRRWRMRLGWDAHVRVFELCSMENKVNLCPTWKVCLGVWMEGREVVQGMSYASSLWSSNVHRLWHWVWQTYYGCIKLGLEIPDPPIHQLHFVIAPHADGTSFNRSMMLGKNPSSSSGKSFSRSDILLLLS